MSNGFGSFIGALFLISVCAAIVSFISPDGELKKYVRLVASLAVLAAIVIPVVGAVTGLPNKISELEFADVQGQEKAEFDIISLSAAEIEKSVSAQVENKFSLSHGSVSTRIVLNSEDVSAIEITDIAVTVPSAADAESVREYVAEMFKNTANVTVLEESDDR